MLDVLSISPGSLRVPRSLPRYTVTHASIPSPPKTCTEAAMEARSVLRRFREASRNAVAPPPSAPLRLTVQLPVPSPSGREDDFVRPFDEGEWPGGIQQRFRALRPLIERMLEGYSAEFVGMLESPADGIGVWAAMEGTSTVVANVSNATFSPFARLCAGEFGSRVLDPGHLLVAVNPSWTTSADIGQLWQRQEMILRIPPLPPRVFCHAYTVAYPFSNKAAVSKSRAPACT